MKILLYNVVYVQQL